MKQALPPVIITVIYYEVEYEKKQEKAFDKNRQKGVNMKKR